MINLLQQFLEHKNAQGASWFTIRNYRREIGEFLRFLEAHKVSLEQINPRIVRKYIVTLTGQNLSPFSIQRKLYEIRSFFRYLQAEGLADVSPEIIPVPQAPQRLPRFLTKPEITRLLCEPKSIRDQAILETFYGTGIRLNELATLNMGNLDLRERLLKVKGKGNKERIVILGQPALEAIRLYLKYRKPQPYERALFLSEAGTRLSRRSINHLVSKHGEKALGKRVTPRLLRHTFATHLHSGGADLRTIQEFLGHADVQTTQIYTHVTPERAREAYNTSHPLGGQDEQPI